MKALIEGLLRKGIPIGNPIYRFLYKCARRYVAAYENVNYDFRVNGEAYVLQKLAECGMSVIFDVGANRGEWTRLAIATNPGARIHSFEIVPSTFALLKDAVSGLEGVTLNNVGLNDRAGTCEILVSQAKDTHSTMVSTTIGRNSEFKPISVNCITGDDYCAANDVQHIDLLKIDVEGAEPAVLRGFSKMLSSGKISVIQFEYTEINIDSRYLLKDFYAVLGCYGYVVGKLYPNGVDFKAYDFRDENFRGPNYIAALRMRDDVVEAMRLKSRP